MILERGTVVRIKREQELEAIYKDVDCSETWWRNSMRVFGTDCVLNSMLTKHCLSVDLKMDGGYIKRDINFIESVLVGGKWVSLEAALKGETKPTTFNIKEEGKTVRKKQTVETKREARITKLKKERDRAVESLHKTQKFQESTDGQRKVSYDRASAIEHVKFLNRELAIESIKDDIGVIEIISNNPATIILHVDDDKTVTKTTEGDSYNPEFGFLLAYFKKHSGLSNSRVNLLLDRIGGRI